MKSISYWRFTDRFLAYPHYGEYVLEYGYVQVWIIAKKMKAEPNRLIPRKLTDNLSF